MIYTFKRTADSEVQMVEHQGMLIATAHGRHGFELEPGFEEHRMRLALACKHARLAGFWKGRTLLAKLARLVGFWKDRTPLSITVTLTAEDLALAERFVKLERLGDD